jgi:hypothetical protein
VFLAGRVLWEQTDQMRGVDGDVDAADCLHPSDVVFGERAIEQCTNVFDDPRVLIVERNAKALRPRMRRDATVSEVSGE